ncbi:MAG: hypothetical protein ACP5H2_10695 [Solirubrobacteraceae bacterium]
MTRTYLFKHRPAASALAVCASAALIAGCGASGAGTTASQIGSGATTTVAANSGSVPPQNASSGSPKAGNGRSASSSISGSASALAKVSGQGALVGGRQKAASASTKASSDSALAAVSGSTVVAGSQSVVRTRQQTSFSQGSNGGGAVNQPAKPTRSVNHGNTNKRQTTTSPTTTSSVQSTPGTTAPVRSTTSATAPKAGGRSSTVTTPTTPEPTTTGHGVQKVTIRYVIKRESPAIPSGAFLPSGHPHLTLDSFTVPDQNITCALSSGSLRCVIARRHWTAPTMPSSCNAAGWGSVITVPASAPPAFTCTADTTLAHDVAQVPNNWDDSIGSFTCEVRSFGVNCFTTHGRYGLILSRTGYTFY